VPPEPEYLLGDVDVPPVATVAAPVLERLLDFGNRML
jgi:hypothetical protein